MTATQTLDIAGRAYAYRDLGQGLPTLWLHAFPLTGESFEPQMQALASSCRLIVPDHRGFGSSGLGTGPSTMESLADDALVLLTALKIERAVVAGISMGGYAAMALTRLDPGRVRALLLIDTQMSPDDAPGKQKREETALAIEAKGPSHLVDTLVPKLVSPAAPAELKSRLTGWVQSANPVGLAAAVRGMALRSDSRDILARFHGPACIVVGSEDGITPPAKAKAMAELIHGATFETIAGAGHLSPLEASDQFNAVAKTFLNALA